MSYKFEIREKGRITLVGIEIFILSILAAMWLKGKYSWDTYSTVIASIVIAIVLGWLFFRLRPFRYIFSILFSLVWGLLAFYLAEGMTDSSAARWVAFGLVTFSAILIHKDYFNFER